jgi:hypothetical protein
VCANVNKIETDAIGAGDDFKKPFRPKFTDKTDFGPIYVCNYDFMWIENTLKSTNITYNTHN